jgi:pyridoxal phosphate enzyme (YggS family)
MSNIAANIEAVYERIDLATQRAGRKASDITLVTVTKTHPLETVVEAYQVGLRHFGENRAQEGVVKVAGLTEWLRANPGNESPQWHFIGHLQSRQVGMVLAGQFGLIHSVDSLRLARRINRLAERDNYPAVEILLQCSISGEVTKSGFELSDWASGRKQFADFLETIAQIATLDKITIRGLMTMAPLSSNPEDARPAFQSLAALREKLQTEMPSIDWQHLSMGMTDDFEVAIEEGSTIIRVGRAILGERIY